MKPVKCTKILYIFIFIFVFIFVFITFIVNKVTLIFKEEFLHWENQDKREADCIQKKVKCMWEKVDGVTPTIMMELKEKLSSNAKGDISYSGQTIVVKMLQ